MFQSKLPPIIKGEGVNPDVGGFATIIINGKPYPAHVVAAAVETVTQYENDGVEHYPLQAVILKSHNGQHWTLKLSGTINGRSFDVEHYQPLTVEVDRVAELRSHYEAVGFIERLQHQTELRQMAADGVNVVDDYSTGILEPTIKFIVAEDTELAVRDQRISELEKVIEEFEDHKGKDWLELHDQVMISERKVVILQEDNVRLAKRGRTFNWLIGDIDDEEPAVGSQSRIFRTDQIGNEAGRVPSRDALLDEAPSR